jgi:hypothetical protein
MALSITLHQIPLSALASITITPSARMPVSLTGTIGGHRLCHANQRLVRDLNVGVKRVRL